MAAAGFKQEQRWVALAMVAALLTTIVAMTTAMTAPSAPLPFAARLQTAFRLELFVVAWLAAAIANVARLRFFSERDIAGSGAEPASDRVRVAGAVLQNTVEQVVLALAAHIVLVAVLDRSDAPIATLVVLFCVGRLLFWLGYAHGAQARAFGFGLTFYPSIVALLIAAWVMLGGRLPI